MVTGKMDFSPISAIIQSTEWYAYFSDLSFDDQFWKIKLRSAGLEPGITESTGEYANYSATGFFTSADGHWYIGVAYF